VLRILIIGNQQLIVLYANVGHMYAFPTGPVSVSDAGTCSVSDGMSPNGNLGISTNSMEGSTPAGRVTGVVDKGRVGVMSGSKGDTRRYHYRCSSTGCQKRNRAHASWGTLSCLRAMYIILYRLKFMAIFGHCK
jgi:hypothetical protein